MKKAKTEKVSIENSTDATQKNKMIHMEILRIIAALFVIFNHSSMHGYFLFSLYPFATRPYFSYMAFTVISKNNVPIFLMITGALLLKKDLDTKKIIQKIVRMLIVLVVFTAVFYIRLHVLEYSDTFTISDFFVRLYEGNIIIPYWYIYAYISFLLAFPFLRAMVKSLPDKAYRYLIYLATIFMGLIPCIEYRLFSGDATLNQYGKIGWLCSSIVLYPLVGYYLENKVDISKISKKNLLLLCGASAFGVAVSCYMTYYKHRITGYCTEAKTQDFMDAFVLIQSVTLYLLVKIGCTKIKFPNWLNKSILSVGSCTFGIYLVHLAIIESKFVFYMFDKMTLEYHINCMLTIWLLCIMTMFISYTITFVLRLIPGVKKLI